MILPIGEWIVILEINIISWGFAVEQGSLAHVRVSLHSSHLCTYLLMQIHVHGYAMHEHVYLGM